MSSINPGGGSYAGGNSINPGIPGASNADEWSKYQAVQNVDFGGFVIQNAVIEDISQTLVDETLSGTTILANNHEFSGNLTTLGAGIFRRGDAMGIVNDPSFLGKATLRIGTGTITKTGDYNEWETACLSNGDLTITHSGTNALSNYNAIVLGNTLNDGILIRSSETSISGDVAIDGSLLSTTGNLNVAGWISGDSLDIDKGVVARTLTLENGDAEDFSLGIAQMRLGINGTPNYPQFISTSHNAGTGAGNRIGLFTSDGTENGVFPTNARLGLTIENENIDVPNNITCGNVVQGVNGLFTDMTICGTLLCDKAEIDDLSCDGVIDVGTINSDPSDTLAITGQITDALFRKSGATGQWGTNQQSVKAFANLGTFYTTNCLRLSSPNEPFEFNIDCFAGAASSSVADSRGFYCRNTEGNYVGFAHSEIGGVKQYSFTASHQCQYEGDLSSEHLGMLVEATGRIVGLQEKGKLYVGISQEAPEYSNATAVIKLTTSQASKKVMGVIEEIFDEPNTTKGSLMSSWNGDGYEVGDKRVSVNAIGEGLVWVVDTAGSVLNGDLIQSSSVAGYAEKQSDDCVRSSSVGKLTADCDFIQETIQKKIILKDDDGQNILDSQGRLQWVNGGLTENKYLMRYLSGGRKACLLPCVYYCG